jgi:hypothetical protein
MCRPPAGPSPRQHSFLLLLLLVLAVVFPIALGTAHPAAAQVATLGEWRTLSQTMPINPIHAALLRTGKILVVAGSENDPTETVYRAAVWDPATNSATTQTTPWDLFCNAMSQLPDGRFLITGGNKQYNPFRGIRTTTVFDPATEAFIQVQDMARGRWYPSNALLSDGTTATFSGWLEDSGGTNSAVEIYEVGVGWSPELDAPFIPPLYPWLHLLPDGRLFFSGSTPASRFFNSGSRTWSGVAAQTGLDADRFFGSSVLLPLRPETGYAPRIMIMGGGNPSTATAEIIDLSQPLPAWRSLPSMSGPRSDMNAVLLPNGTVLALGGSGQRKVASTATLGADLFDPVSETWSPAGTMAFPRLYHSVALLMPDATVWVAGSNPQEGVWESKIEVYSPPYLFTSTGARAARPSIAGAPSTVGYGAAFSVQTPNATDVASAVLIRPGSSTHAYDFDQRVVGLTFIRENGTLTVTAPPNPGVAPPGYYMLFLLNSAGVPSIARFVQLSETPGNALPRATITNPAADVTIAPGQTVTFAGTGTDANGSIARYSWVFPGGSPAGSTVATPGAVTFANPGRYVASLTVTDDLGDTDPSPPTRVVTVQPAGFAASFTSPDAGANVSGTVAVGMAATGGSGSLTYTLAIDGTTVSTQTTSAATAAYAWNTVLYADGARTLALTVTDTAGHTSTVNRTATVANGTSGSLGVELTSPLSGETVKGAVGVNVWVEGASTPPFQFTMSVGGTIVGTASAPQTHVTLSWDTAQTPDGARTLLVTVRDSAGRLGSRAVPVTVQNGTAPPTASFTSPGANATVSGTVAVGMAVSGGTPSYTYQLSIDGTSAYSATSAATSASYSWNTTTVANGSHTLRLTLTDNGGQTSTVTRTVTVQNTTPPPAGGLDVYITTPAPGATVTGSVTVNIWVEKATGSATVYTLSVGGQTVWTQTSAGAHVWGDWDSRTVADGPATLVATVRDATGKTGTGTLAVTARNGTSPPPSPPPPTASFTSPGAGATVSGATPVGMAVTGGSPSYTYQLAVDGASVFNQTTANTSVTYSWSTTSVSDGAHTLTVTVTDGGGRTSTATRTVTVNNATGGTLGVELTSPIPGLTVRGTVAVNVWVTGTSTAPYTCTISVASTVVDTTTSSGTHVTFGWNTTQTANGSRSLTVTVTDAAGRTGSRTIPVVVQNP